MTLLKIRPAQEDPDEKLHRGPLYMEPAVSALHSLKGSDSEISMEMGMGRDSKISFYVRGTHQRTDRSLFDLSPEYPLYPWHLSGT